MSNSEQHEMLVGILCNLVPILTCDELSLLAHSCGVPVEEFYGNASNVEWRKA